MHTFVVVAGKGGRKIPRQVLETLRREDLPELVFEPESHAFWLSGNRDVAFGGWQAAPSAFGRGDHWSIRPSGLTAFAGYLWPTAGGWTTARSWTEQLADWCKRRDLAKSTDGLNGIYAVVSVSTEGSGLVVSDPLGLCVLYIGETSEVAVISNRASLAAKLISSRNKEPERDPIGTGWLTYFGSIVGDTTGFTGVRTVPQGSSATIDQDRGLRVRARNGSSPTAPSSSAASTMTLRGRSARPSLCRRAAPSLT
jgi:hypothetical protein